MSRSSSSNSTQQVTETTNQDNRVAAEAGGIALGANAQVDLKNEFSDNVRASFDNALELARQAGAEAVDFANKAIDRAAERARQAEQTEAVGQNKIVADLFPVAALAVFAIIAVQIFTKR